jgi:hypothetical protein
MGAYMGNLASLLGALQGLSKAYQVLWINADGASTRAVNVRSGKERNA